MTEPAPHGPGSSRLQRAVVALARRVVGPRRWASWRARYWTWRASHRTRRAEARARAVIEERDRIENRRWNSERPRIVVASEVTAGRHFYWYFLEWLERERPSLRRRIRLARVPCRLPAGTRVFHAWVQDPVAERDSRLYAQLVSMEAACGKRGIAVIHPAAVLSHSRREVLGERLRRAGVRTPRVAAVDTTFDVHRGGLHLPMLVRRPWGHTVDMRRLDTAADFNAWWAEARSDPAAWVAVEFVDVRSADGFYRKYRYFLAGSRGVPRHLIVSPKWEVRPADRIRTATTQQEELAFVGSPCPHHELFDAARRSLDFEIAAFDYSYDSNQELIVWEVNPFPDLSTPSGPVGEYLQPAIHSSYTILADYYEDRARL